MFDTRGRLIGINGRGSFEKRGRVNVGVGYAIFDQPGEELLGAFEKRSGGRPRHAGRQRSQR